MGGSSSKTSPAGAEGASGGAPPAKAKGRCCGRGAGKDPEWGMARSRKCRDVFCLVLFGLFWVGMLAIGALGIKYGRPMRLLYGTDFAGRTCGAEEDGMGAKRYMTYPRTNEDFIANLGKTNPLDYTFYGVCVDKCPGALDVVCPPGVGDNEAVYTQAARRQCIVDPAATPPAGVDCNTVRSSCWLYPLPTASMNPFFRCIPVYNVTSSSTTVCTYPPGVADAWDPRCIIVQEDTAGSVARPAKPNILFDQLNTGRQLWGRWFGDLARSWWVILACGVGVAVVAGFVWVTLLKYFTACMVWTTVALVLVLTATMTGFFYYKAGLLRGVAASVPIPPTLAAQLADVASTASSAATTASAYVPQSWSMGAEEYQKAFSALAYASTGVLIILLCIVVALRKAIATAIDVIKIGTDALRALPGLLFFPCTNTLAIGLFLVWWVFVAACLQSSGEVTVGSLSSEVSAGVAVLEDAAGAALPANVTAALLASMGALNQTVASVADRPVMNYLLIYHIFGLLWTAQFIQGVAAMTVAGAVASWYFAQLPKETEAASPELAALKQPAGRCSICRSLGRVARYYLGSVAFGALLIAIIQAIRLAFAYVQRKLEPQAKNNASLRFLLCCIQCCLKCLQSLVETVTRNAFIFVALKGYSFCGAGGAVFKLIVAHGSVFAAVNVLGEIIMFLGKVIVSLVCAWVAFALLDNLPQFQPGGDAVLSSTWLPILVTLFFAYATASGFMMVLDLTVDTVLVCYCTDVDEAHARGGASVAVHMHVDKLAVGAAKKKAAAAAAAGAGGAGDAGKGGAASAPTRVVQVAPPAGAGAGVPAKGAAAMI